jgi:hypothetical protein
MSHVHYYCVIVPEEVGEDIPVAWIILEMENEEKEVDEWRSRGECSRGHLIDCLSVYHEFTRLKDASGSGFFFSVLL